MTRDFFRVATILGISVCAQQDANAIYSQVFSDSVNSATWKIAYAQTGGIAISTKEFGYLKITPYDMGSTGGYHYLHDGDHLVQAIEPNTNLKRAWLEYWGPYTFGAIVGGCIGAATHSKGLEIGVSAAIEHLIGLGLPFAYSKEFQIYLEPGKLLSLKTHMNRQSDGKYRARFYTDRDTDILADSLSFAYVAGLDKGETIRINGEIDRFKVGQDDRWDWFGFVSNAGGYVEVKLAGLNNNVEVHVYNTMNGKRKRLAFYDDKYEDLTLRINTRIGATYHIGLTNAADKYAEKYTMTITQKGK